MPSCLIELGFISTPDEERLLNNDTSIDNIARGIYNAFIAYKRTYSNDGITYSPEEPSAFPDSREDRQVAQNTAPVPAKELPSQNVTVSVPAQEVSVNVPAQEPTVNTGLRFKVQIFVSDIVLKTNDSRFKGRKDAEYYTEGGMVKYTIGESADFNEMNNLRRQLDPTFRGCFVIAFKDGHKMDINEALREWRKTTGRK